ncbi:hypothetical protein [Ekhidna sp. To15]|uniref:hypothetical protein n=1 Tax=Ekhidna sp. To15 TaxID=3395267 RepID=UPI003F52898D
MTAEAYYNILKAKYQEASKNVEIIRKVIVVGELEIVLSFAGSSLVPTFFKAFDHLEKGDETQQNKSIHLYFWDSESTNSELVDDTPWKGSIRHHLGLIESWTNENIHTLQQPGSEAIYMFNKNANEGIYWVSSVSKIPFWESDFPLRMIFHWWLIDSSYQPIHAGAVGKESGGLLLVGKGGSGKSTSTLSCLNSNLKIAGDDYVLLDSNLNLAYSLFSLSKLNHRSIRLLNNKELNLDSLPPPIEDKYRIKLYPKFENALIEKIPIKAILLPTVTTNRETKIVECSSAQAMIALAPTTLFQLPGYREKSFIKMSKFIKQIPSFHLYLGADFNKLPNLLENFIDSLTRDHKTVAGSK